MPATDSRPIYVSGDVHLGAIPKDREGSFVRWLEHAAAVTQGIILNGDLFDFWFEYASVIPRGHTRVLGALAAAVDAGVPVTLVGGNHDWWGGSYFEQEIGVTFLRDPVLVQLAGRRTFLAHGDGLGRGDLGYRAVRWMLRGRTTRWAFRWLHPDVGAAVARLVSKTEDRGPTEDEKRRARSLEEWAIGRLRADPALEMVVLGHTHIPVLAEVEPGRWLVNSGDWIAHRSYLSLAPGAPPRVLEWEVSAPGAGVRPGA
ncbi:MAG: UDP-2,3-diacylglucosamine diphosphatase [Gemmatimonadetes bacterium]|nr:UDP-2,3-diacylglucosamine diphosphatase [Gemmatimonadota bacterium]